MTPGKKLIKLRTDKKMTQKAAAEALGVHINTYSKWERSSKNLSSEAVDKLAKFYGKEKEFFIDSTVKNDTKKSAVPKKKAGKTKAKAEAKAVAKELSTVTEDIAASEDLSAKPVDTPKEEVTVEKETVREVKAEKPLIKKEKKTAKRPGAKTKEKAKAKTSSRTSSKVSDSSKPSAKAVTTSGKAEAKSSEINIELQYAGKAIPYTEIIERARAAAGKKSENLNIYIKPEENRAYYVAGSNVGSFEI